MLTCTLRDSNRIPLSRPVCSTIPAENSWPTPALKVKNQSQTSRRS